MPRVYAIASAKGGVGKTTTTANVAATLAEAGEDVVVVDGDLGMANLAATLGVDPDGATLHDVLAETADPDEAVYPGPAGLRVVPGATALDAFSDADPRGLESVISTFADADYVLIDVGAGLSYETSIPLSVADEIVLVSTADRDALVDTEKTRRLAERLDGSVRGAVITRVDPGVPVADLVESHLDAPILATIPEDEAVRESIAAGEPLATYAPNSAAAGAYRTLVTELTGVEVPDPPEPPEAYTPDPIDPEEPDEEAAETVPPAELDDGEILEDDSAVDEPVEEPATDEPVEEPAVADADDEPPAEPEDDEPVTTDPSDDQWAEAAGVDDDMIVAESDLDSIADETPTMTAVGGGMKEVEETEPSPETAEEPTAEEPTTEEPIEEAEEPPTDEPEGEAIDEAAIPFQGDPGDPGDPDTVEVPEAEPERDAEPSEEDEEDDDEEADERGFFSRLLRRG